MAIAEVHNRAEFGPYSAVIGTDSEWLQGQIRIVPPFNPGAWLKSYFEGDELKIEHVATDSSATVLDFVFNEDSLRHPPTEDLIMEHTKTLLEFLGTVSSHTLFKAYWSKYGERED